MMEKKMLVYFILCTLYGYINCKPRPDDENIGEGARGADIWKKLLIFNPELAITKPPIPDPNVPKKRKSRGEQWMMKFQVKADFTTTTTTPIPTTTTKSPEQIAEEKRKTQERNDPKNFLNKIKQLNLLEEKSKGGNLDKEVKEMDKKMHKMLEGCNDNSDCGNSTCCYKKDAAKRGECIMAPHRLNQHCSDLCACQGKHEGIELECKVMELALTDDSSTIKESRQCRQRELTEHELMQQVLKKMREAKQRGPRTLRTQRIMFT